MMKERQPAASSGNTMQTHWRRFNASAPGTSASEKIQAIRKKSPLWRSCLFVPAIGLTLLILELWKQCYLFYFVFGRHYSVWYVPFQLCSMPIYLSLLYTFLLPRHQTAASAAADRLSGTISLFLRDYGILGGIAALLVPAGFTWPEHPLLTLHGYVWHILLILLGLLLSRRGLCARTYRSFFRTVPLFLCLSAAAELINFLLHPYGDCDMFYISPYHLSSQPVFHEVDALIGRIPGIAVYLFAVMLGAYLIHCCFQITQRLKKQHTPS